MISNNPTESQASPRYAAKAGAAKAPIMDPRGTIEVASGGSSPINDPSGKDKPPGLYDLDLLA